MKPYHFIIFIMLLIYSCTSSDTNSSIDITFTELRKRVNANAEKLKSLDADGEISIDSPQLSNTGSITVSINKPDSVFTKLEGPFGIDVAYLLITRNNFVYYNVMDNKVIRGLSTPENLGIIMRIKATFDEIMNAFSGKFSFISEGYEDTKISMEENNYVVKLNTGNEIKKYWIDSENYYVRKVGTYDIKGITRIEIVYQNFFERDNIYFPKNISISRPKENQNIWLTYFREEFNNNRLNYKMKIPKSAKQINW